MSKLREPRDYRDQGNPDAKIYVGDITFSASRQDLEETFSYYGPIKSSWVARNPPGFAFVEFEDARDAEDAVRDTEGVRQYCRRLVCGRRVRIELSNRSRRSRVYDGGSSARERDRDTRCFDCGLKGHTVRNCTQRSNISRSRRSISRGDSRSKRDGIRRRSPSYTRGRRSPSYTKGSRRSPSYTKGGRRSPSYTSGGRRSPSYTKGGRRSPSYTKKDRRSPSPSYKRIRRSPSYTKPVRRSTARSNSSKSTSPPSAQLSKKRIVSSPSSSNSSPVRKPIKGRSRSPIGRNGRK